MATIKRRTGTNNWTACFRDYAGRRVQKTTGLASKKEAQRVADEMERAASSPPAAPPPEQITMRAWAAGWLAANKGTVNRSTFLYYSHRSEDFVKHLGGLADKPAVTVTKADVIAYRTAILASVAPSTANLAITVLRMMFEAARREKVIAENPAADLKALKHENKVNRRPFTVPELKALLAVASGEWRSIILFGIYTGQRLADLALLTWSNIDTVAGEIRLRARKTGRFMAIPIAEPLAKHIEALDADDDPGAHVHPKSAAAVLSGKKRLSSTLSGQFYNLMASAGIAPPRQRSDRKNGRGVPRQTRDLCFHSLRHTATSLMKNAGISSAVVQDIIGHDSPAVSAIYTHIDSVAKRKALDSMPDLVG